jgi:hypothetical protein
MFKHIVIKILIQLYVIRYKIHIFTKIVVKAYNEIIGSICKR